MVIRIVVASICCCAVLFLLQFKMGNVLAGGNLVKGVAVLGDEAIMAKKEHGTCSMPVMEDLRWNCDYALADKISCYTRRFAENAGYWVHTSFLSDIEDVTAKGGTVTFYDSVTGKRLFEAPKGRTWDAFLAESRSHGWPSFRDAEVDWDNVRVIPGGETVSTTGTHLGHNLPDRNGNRYCINIASISGTRKDDSESIMGRPVDEL